jgi:hypothetical protein
MTTHRSKIGPLVGGALLIGLGLMTLLGQLFHNFHFWAYAWPLLVIGFGGLFFVGMFAGGKSMAGLAIPGSIITVSGLMLLIQNLTGAWASWSYSWTVTLASVGLGIFSMGLYQGDEQRRQTGLRIMKIAAVLFVLFGAFFQLLLSPFGLNAGRYTFPLLMIALGVYLVVTRSGLFQTHKAADETVAEVSA